MPRKCYTFNFIPKFKEMVKIMDHTENKEYSTSSVQFRRTCWMFSSPKEFLKKADFKHWKKSRRVFLLPTCNCETCHSRRNQAVQSVGLYVLGQEGLGETTTFHALEAHLLNLCLSLRQICSPLDSTFLRKNLWCNMLETQ